MVMERYIGRAIHVYSIAMMQIQKYFKEVKEQMEQVQQQDKQKTKQITTSEYLNNIHEALMNQIAQKMGAMPDGFNKDRFVLNCITLIRIC